MVRLTVLYNLAPDQNEEEFLAWRLGEHQQENASQPGVLRTDFAQVVGAWPDGAPQPWRFMTTAEWPDMESFRAAFYEPGLQAEMFKSLPMLANPVYLVTEILAQEVIG